MNPGMTRWNIDPIYSKEEPAQNPSIRTALNLQPNLFGNNELSDIVDEQHPKVFANGQKKATDDVINSSSNLATPAKISSKTLSDSDMEPHLPSNNKINLSGKHIKELLEDSTSNENRSKLPHKLNSISKRKRNSCYRCKSKFLCRQCHKVSCLFRLNCVSSRPHSFLYH